MEVSAYSALVTFTSHFTHQKATENTSAAVGAASSATGSGVQVENEDLQLHGVDHPAVGAASSATGSGVQVENEALQLHGADHPGMVLVSAPLTRKNYLNWSYAIKRALRVKMKLGLIDGSLLKPDVNDASFEKWIRVDSMVTTWILNSISKEIVEGFMYTKYSRSLWLDLEERYG
ncbi:hypothetical protein Sango_1162700 [Sesamum angolense]|uniref:Retrotransposon Copia-like N-terminal domain-containing protein n=1 Tax=Sesamum angolense TaxID=2727404 RepID=A0AAE2BWN4_9LAMI|nr:hypothetical protein Sango_1162700 [Sesamum angolense]